MGSAPTAPPTALLASVSSCARVDGLVKKLLRRGRTSAVRTQSVETHGFASAGIILAPF
jgi:hypothetical protein